MKETEIIMRFIRDDKSEYVYESATDAETAQQIIRTRANHNLHYDELIHSIEIHNKGDESVGTILLESIRSRMGDTIYVDINVRKKPCIYHQTVKYKNKEINCCQHYFDWEGNLINTIYQLLGNDSLEGLEASLNIGVVFMQIPLTKLLDLLYDERLPIHSGDDIKVVITSL